MTELQKEPWGPMGDASRHLPLENLEAEMDALPAPPKDSGRLVLIVRRLADGSRDTPERVTLSQEEGVPGDGWYRRPPRTLDAQLAVTRHDVATLIANGQPVTLCGDNLLVDLDISSANLPAGTLLRVGEATVEVTAKPHTGCSKYMQRFGKDALRFVNGKPRRDQHLRGIYWKVVTGGDIEVGSPIEVISRGSQKDGQTE